MNPIAFFIFHRRRGTTSTTSSVYSSDNVLKRVNESGNSLRNTPVRESERVPLKMNVKKESFL